MCGILGYIGNIPQKNWPEAHTLLSNIWIKSMMRGKDAAGFSAIHNLENPRLITEKRPVTSEKLISRSGKYKALRRYMPSIFIAHTRATTSGPAKRNRNNHPFNSSRYSLVHNGSVSDWQKLIPSVGLDEKMRTGCDSEVLIHLIEEKDEISDGVQHMMNTISKSSRVAVAALQHHPDLTRRLWLFRNNTNPVFILTVPQWRSIFFASTDFILDSALKETYGNELSDVIKKYSINKASLPSWELCGFGFDGNIPIPLEKFDIEERKMGFVKNDKAPIYSNSAAKTSDKEVIMPMVKVSSTKTIGNESSSVKKEDSLSMSEKLSSVSETTRKKISNLTMLMDDCLPILNSLRNEPMMQNIELDHFKKWMLKKV